MLIRDVHIVDNKIRIFDIDGSYIDLTADDAIDLRDWLNQHGDRLLLIMREDMRRMQQQWKEGNVG